MPSFTVVLGIILVANGGWWEIRRGEVALEKELADNQVAIHLHSADVYLVSAYTSPADARANLHMASHENEIAFENLSRARNAANREKIYKSISIGSFAAGTALIVTGLIRESRVKWLRYVEVDPKVDGVLIKRTFRF